MQHIYQDENYLYTHYAEDNGNYYSYLVPRFYY